MTAVRHGLTLLTAALALSACAGAPGPAPKTTASPSPSTSVIMKKTPRPKAHTLGFRITGHGTMHITYTVDGAKTAKTVTLPWRRTIHLPPRADGHDWRLKLSGGYSTSTVVVSVDGTPISQSSCAGTNCNGSHSGSVGD
ncbi:MAG TPA: hypothetical protein VGL93_31235 [Streptosporangiaceae bacterium]|jgi:hypothetical protein